MLAIKKEIIDLHSFSNGVSQQQQKQQPVLSYLELIVDKGALYTDACDALLWL